MMKKQFIVLGLGSFGANVAVTLQRMGCDVVATLVPKTVKKIPNL